MSSWSRAHHTIGTGFIIAGFIAIGAAIVVLLAPAGATGPLTVAGSVVLLGPVVIGIALGFRQLERRG